MSKDLNQCTFIGRLGNDPECRYSQQGTCFANFNIAVGDDYTDKQTNQKHERTEWVPIVMSGRQAEVAAEYLRKGSKVCVVGKFKTRKWQDQQGQDRYKSEIHAQSMQMLDSKQDGQGQQGGYAQQPQQAPAQPNYSAPPQAANRNPNPPPAPSMESFDDDIPF